VASGKVYVSGVSYELGSSSPISEICELKENPELLDAFQTLGLKSYCKSSISPADLARPALERTLKTVGIAPARVDALVYATSSFWNPAFQRREEISRLIDVLELENAYPTGVTLSESANLQSAIRVAAGLVALGDCDNVLVVATDRIADMDTRIVAPRISVKSDAAASCLISADPHADFELVGARQTIRPSLWDVDAERDLMHYMESINDALATTVHGALAACGCDRADILQVFANNYNISVLRTYAATLKFEPARIYSKNIGRTAHAVAADNFINLADYVAETPPAPGSLLALVGAGPNLWGASVLRTM
jgi:3-oxoacyl-[acyl-carrier-protein] synthase III